VIPDFVNRYLMKRGHVAELSPEKCGNYFQQAVVIPAMAESRYLPATIKSLTENCELMIQKTLFIAVVNCPPDASAEIFQDNLDTVEFLKKQNLRNLFYINTVIDGGVGGARKLGMDTALNILDWNSEPLLFCLDADTLTEPEYLEKVRFAMLAHPQWSGAVVNFSHQLPDNAELSEVVAAYEFFMRYYVAGLRWAGSPYAFYSLGSATICRASAYVRCGGMRVRNGGEDFYFAQALRKIGEIGFIDDTVIYPAGRISDRVDFGTGPKLNRLLNGEPLSFYNFQIFGELKKLLDLVAAVSPEALPTRLSAVLHSETVEFMRLQNFFTAWPKILHNTPPGDANCRRAFHTWFDGFRTLKLIHHLERNVSEYHGININEAALAIDSASRIQTAKKL